MDTGIHSELGVVSVEEKTLGKYWNSPMAEDIRQEFWDVANISERANLNLLVRHNLDLAQKNLYQAWKLQTHMNELGEFEKAGE